MGAPHGANNRILEILKRGKNFELDYVVVFDKRAYKQAVNSFPELPGILENYSTYFMDVLEEKPVRYFNQIVRFIYSYKAVRTLKEIAEKENVDLLIAPHESVYLALLLRRVSKKVNKPWTTIFNLTPGFVVFHIDHLITEKNPWIEFFNRAKSSGIIEAMRKITQFFVLLRVLRETTFLSVSPNIIIDLRTFDSQLKGHVIYPGAGVDFKKIKAAKPSMEKHDAIFFARLIPQKGLFDIIKIWKKVTESIPDATIAVSGVTMGPVYVDRFLKEVKQEHLDKNIKFYGYLPQEELIGLVKSSNFLVYPSRLDAFSSVILEALSAGIPVITYDILSVRLNYGACGAVVSVPLGDHEAFSEKVLEFIQNGSLRKRLSVKAYRFATKFSWDNVVKAEKEAYQMVMKQYLEDDCIVKNMKR
jgi:glycosyltransferase involved in cell wall biosynthesis